MYRDIAYTDVLRRPIDSLLKRATSVLLARSYQLQRRRRLRDPDLWGLNINERSRLAAGNIDLADLLARYGSPLLIVHRQQLLRDASEVIRAFQVFPEGSRILYSLRRPARADALWYFITYDSSRARQAWFVRLAAFQRDGGMAVGSVQEDTVVPLPGVASVLELARAGRAGVEAVADAPRRSRLPLAEVELLAPIKPPRVFCVGWNYRLHFDEGIGRRGDDEVERLPESPTLFTKADTAVTTPYGPIALHRGLTGMLDWEAELAVVVGAGGVDIPDERALEHVLGYAVANDVTARDLQRSYGGQWFKGKSLDGSCPLGPWITTRDEVPDPQALTLTCRVNGEEKQHGRTRDMIFGVSRLVAELSAGMTLLPGDLILTGTPAGVGYARTPPERLEAGDVVETEISSLGVLRNLVVDGERSGSDGIR